MTNLKLPEESGEKRGRPDEAPKKDWFQQQIEEAEARGEVRVSDEPDFDPDETILPEGVGKEGYSEEELAAAIERHVGVYNRRIADQDADEDSVYKETTMTRFLRRWGFLLTGLLCILAVLVYRTDWFSVNVLHEPQLATAPIMEKVEGVKPITIAKEPFAKAKNAAPAKAEAEPVWKYLTFEPGDAMHRLFTAKDAKQVQADNPEVIKNVDKIRAGDTVRVRDTIKIHKRGFRIVDCSRTSKGFCEYRNPGADKMCGVRDPLKALTSHREYGLSDEQAMLVIGMPEEEAVLLPAGTVLTDLSFGHGHWKGPVVLKKDMWAYHLADIDGQRYLRFEACCNLARMPVPARPIVVETVPEAQPAIELPQPQPTPAPAAPAEPLVLQQAPQEPEELVGEATPEEVKPLSAFPSVNELEWELISGAGVWDNNLAHGDWLYAEGALLARLPEGYSLGAGFFGMKGKGESELSEYSWKEHGYGPQLALKRNYLKEQKDEFDQYVLLPAGWTVKLRYLGNDKVSGGNPVSGYHMTQRGDKLGLYAEYFERTSLDWLWGVSGEIWDYRNGSIQSTWSGDKPKDRGSWNANIYAQYRINDDWQARGIAGVSHQNWDSLNYLNLIAEMRYRETLMFGPRLSLALNKPEAYVDVSRSDLTTIGAFVRLELGGTIRLADRKEREESVQYVGPVTAEVSAKSEVVPVSLGASHLEAGRDIEPVSFEK